LTNAQRHARAKQITIRVIESGRYLRIEVGDDGEGGADEHSGSGLQGLRDRVEAVGGVLRVASGLGRGTLVRADIPLTRDRP
jgi:signal transduction histidine kinase